MEILISRTSEQQVIDRLDRYPVVAIIGPRQVGKTTLVKKVAENVARETIYLDLESEDDWNKL